MLAGCIEEGMRARVERTDKVTVNIMKSDRAVGNIGYGDAVCAVGFAECIGCAAC